MWLSDGRVERADRELSRRVIWLLLVSGLLVRLLAVAYWAPRLEPGLTGDPAEYLSSGRLLADTGSYHRDPEIDRMPGMAALIALGCLFGDLGCTWFSYVVLSFAGTFSAFALWRMIRGDLDPRARVVSLVVLLVAVPELLFYSFRLLPDLPGMALGIGAVWLMVPESSGRRRPSDNTAWRAVGAGLLLGLSLYLRPDLAVAGVTLAGAWFLILRRDLGSARALIGPSLLVLVMGLSVVPWGLRNQGLTGDFRITSDRGVRAIWDGFNDRRTLGWLRDQQEPWVLDPDGAKGGAVLADALTWIGTHPGEAAALVAWRFVSHFGPAAQPIVSASATQIHHRILRVPYRLSLILLNELWLVLGLLALAVGWRRLPLSLSLVGIYTLSRMVFPGGLYPEGGRFAMSLIPFLAASSLWHWGHRDDLGGRTCSGVVRATIVLVIVQVALLLRWGWV